MRVINEACTLRIAICEDAETDADILTSHIKNSGFYYEQRVFESGEAFLRSFQSGAYDLIFMDIYMKDIRGIETVKAIREIDNTALIAFTTSSPDHTLESYRLGALKYLEKPVSFESVKEMLEFALMKRKNRPFITFTAAGGKQEDIPLDDIVYFEYRDHTVLACLTNRLVTSCRSVKLDDIEKQLPCPPFLRCHRSYLINLNYARRFDKELNAFIMKNGDRADMRRGGYSMYKLELNKWRISEMEKGEL